MKKRERISPPAVGGSSLLVIFAALCLTVLALLSLSTAQAEKRLSDAAADAVTSYYEADLEAERIFAQLRAGEAISGVQEAEGVYSYSCPISETQTLLVRLQKAENSWTVLRWQAVPHPQDISQSLPVWDGK